MDPRVYFAEVLFWVSKAAISAYFLEAQYQSEAAIGLPISIKHSSSSRSTGRFNIVDVLFVLLCLLTILLGLREPVIFGVDFTLLLSEGGHTVPNGGEGRDDRAVLDA